MSAVEILEWLRRLERAAASAPGATIICTRSGCTTLYGASTTLTWSNGLLTEIRVSGVDEEGRTRTFRRILTWTSDGLLESVGPWEEVA